MSNPILKAKIKKTGEVIQVYRLSQGSGYNIFLGDRISITAVENGEHMKTFEPHEIEISKS